MGKRIENAAVSKGYRKDVKLFLIVFAALNLVFFYYQKTFFIGNHDWDWVKGTSQVLSLNTGMFEGRYAKFILNAALFGGQVLPWLNTWLAFSLLAAGTVMLAAYWQLRNNAVRLLVALLPALSPFILGWLYFPINILGNFMAVALVAGGLILSEKTGQAPKLSAIICFLLALGVYPSAAEMMLVCFAFRQIVNPPQNLRDSIKPLLVIIAALVLFKMLLALLTGAGIIYTGHYNVQAAAPAELLARLPQMAGLALHQLFVTMPFFPLALRLCGLALIACAAAISLFTAKFRAQQAAFWLVAMAATVLSAFLAAAPESVAYMPRVNFYGVNFLIAGSAAYLLSASSGRRNLGLLLSVGYLFFSVNQDFLAQKVWQFGKNAEENLVSRISARIESHFRPGNMPPIPVIAGEISLRPRYYPAPYRRNSPYLLEKSFVVRHIPSGMFNFYAPVPLFSGSSQISLLTPELYRFLSMASRPWPAETALYLDAIYAVILLTPEGISAIQAQIPK